VGYNKLPDVQQRPDAAVAEMTAETVHQLGLVYAPLALADMPALANEIAELRRLYLPTPRQGQPSMSRGRLAVRSRHMRSPGDWV